MGFDAQYRQLVSGIQYRLEPGSDMLTLLILLGGFLFSLITLKYFFLPFLLITICWFSLFVFLTVTSKTELRKSVWFNLAFVVLVLGALEVYSYFSLRAEGKWNARRAVSYPARYFTFDRILGYGPKKANKVRVKKVYGNQVIYDVTYTIGTDGQRITPPAALQGSNECILFFGGSYTFGEGINDRESLPYIVGELQTLKVHNFGFHGYGPHQMLAAIDNGMINCQPSLVIYQAIPAHVARSAGKARWDLYGPKYVLRNGRLAYDGHFNEQIHERILAQIVHKLEKSDFYVKFWQARYTVSDYDIDLFLHIVDRARNSLAEKFPGVAFQVIFWDDQPDDATTLKIRTGLKALTIPVLPVSDILPNFVADAMRYKISPYDGHPNALAHRLIAEYVVSHLTHQ